MKNIIYLFFLFSHKILMACPGCSGSMENPREKYLPYVLMVFILLTYIPLSYLFGLIIKYRDVNNNTGPTEIKKRFNANTSKREHI